MNTRYSHLYRICLYALFSALLCILSPLAIPIGPVPVSLSIFAVFLTCSLLGVRAVIAIAIYLALGAIGLPVFAGGMGGLGALAGPTGGFLCAYLPVGVLTGVLYPRVRRAQGRGRRLLLSVAVGVCGLLLCYLIGALRYAAVANVSLLSALSVCVLPFVSLDLCKLLLVGILTERFLKIAVIRRILTALF